MRKYHVGIAGATGLVGQRLVARVASHPWFTLQALGASERSSGRAYGETCGGCRTSPIPEAAASLVVRGCTASEFGACDLVLSALDAPIAREIEPALAAAGIAVVSNSSAFRMAPDVPLIVPEVNGAAVAGIATRAKDGYIVTNPNCSVTGLALALAPLHREFGVRKVVVATMQAVSGCRRRRPARRRSHGQRRSLHPGRGREDRGRAREDPLRRHRGGRALPPRSDVGRPPRGRFGRARSQRLTGAGDRRALLVPRRRVGPRPPDRALRPHRRSPRTRPAADAARSPLRSAG